MISKFTTLCYFSVVSATGVMAQSAGDMSIGVGVSTFGGNLEVGYHTTDKLRVRGALLGGFRYDDEVEVEGINADADGNLGGLTLVADYYPWSNGFRVSGGLFFSTTDLESKATASIAAPIDIGGTNYTSGTVNVEGSFQNNVSPMLTAGYDWSVSNRWTLSGELGAVFVGGVDISVKSDTLQAQIDADTDIQDAIKDAADLNVYPYLALTASFRF